VPRILQLAELKVGWTRQTHLLEEVELEAAADVGVGDGGVGVLVH